MSEEKTQKPFEDELLAEQEQHSPVDLEGENENHETSSEKKDSNEVRLETKDTTPSLEEQLATLKDQLMRQLAETENLRKRTEREREETTRYAVTKFARDMLEIADNLGRAIDACEKESDTLTEAGRTLLEGVSLTQKTLLSTFDRHHIQKLDPKGEKFDHDKHQAMFEVETDEHEPGTILDVMQPGYSLHDRLLRPAMVGVAKKKADS
tara:strand:- start:221 stop:847 length:627 start_codon:yes stop_codon:yes gene_type:complete